MKRHSAVMVFELELLLKWRVQISRRKQSQMIPTKASVLAVQRSKQKVGVCLRRICLLGLDPATVRALGQLLGRPFYLLVPKDEDELLSAVRSGERLDGLVLDARLSGSDKVRLIRAARSIGTSDVKETNLPVFFFGPADDASVRCEMENLGVQGIFQKPGDIWRLAEAIHRELGPVSTEIETTGFGMGPEALIIGAIKYIDENLTNIRSSRELSAHLGVTREHLSRQFTRYTGQTLWDFITTSRIHGAMKLLREKGLLVKQISREVGFNSESSFFRAFTKKTGFTPESFRKAQRD